MVLAESKANNKFYGWYVVFINAFIGCVLSAGFPQASMTVGYLSEKMGISQQVLLTGDTVRTLGIILGMMAAGVAVKKFSSRKVFLFGMVAAIVPQILIPYNSSLILFFILKFAQGIASIVFPVFLIIIMDWIDESQSGISTAVFNGIFYGGGGIGGTFAGFIITKSGWIASYWALAILQLIVAIVWLMTVKEKKKSTSSAGKGETKEGLSLKQMLGMPKLWLLVISFLSTTWTVQAIMVDMPLFGSFLGYSELETGKIMTAITIGIVSACIVSGKISDFFAARTKNKAGARISVLMVGCIIIILSVAMIVLADLKSFTVFYAGTLFFSFGAAWGLGAFYSILPEVFDEDTLPVATGFIGGCGDAGMPLAPTVVGIIFGVKGLWSVGWSTCAIVALLSIISCLILIRSSSKKTVN